LLKWLINRFKKPQSELSLIREASFGHGELGIYNETHAHWSWHRNQDNESIVSDEIWITSFHTSTNSCQKLQESPTTNGRYCSWRGEISSKLLMSWWSPCRTYRRLQKTLRGLGRMFLPSFPFGKDLLLSNTPCCFIISMQK
jgi:hypothetical protein